MGLSETSALLLLAGNLVVLSLLLRRRGRSEASELREKLETLSIRTREIAIAAETGAGPGMSAPGGASPLDDAVARAAAFLRQRLRSGAYGLACTGSDDAPRFSDNKGHVFVASFIVEAMAGLLDEIDRTIVLARILSEENGGLWGFSPPGPFHDDRFRVFHVDADDSAYVIRTLRRLGVNRAPDCLMPFYREAERLFVTFDAPGPASLATEASPRRNFGAHPEVNANIFLALEGTHLERLINLQMLRQTQQESGFWPSYFYPGRCFGTLLALDLLRGKAEFDEEVKRALAFVARVQNEDGSWGTGGDPHETALAVAALAGHRGHAAALRRGVDFLLAAMESDGSWASRAVIWEFHADERDVWRAHDRDRAYVTARCMAALRRAAGHAALP